MKDSAALRAPAQPVHCTAARSAQGLGKKERLWALGSAVRPLPHPHKIFVWLIPSQVLFGGAAQRWLLKATALGAPSQGPLLKGNKLTQHRTHPKPDCITQQPFNPDTQ